MAKIEKITAHALLCIMIISLLPVMYLGRYNHPTGDDYYYGAETRAVWEETGSITKTVMEAVRGTAYQYQVWQGSYSAMFLMYLPPNIFGEDAYHFVTFGILLLFSAGIFYFLKPVVCTFMKGSVSLWMMESSLLTMLSVQTVEFQGESFFWFNGSIYYTGYYALTCIFFGLILRYLDTPKRYRLAVLIFLAFFLAGGNYVSLLPTVLLLLLLVIYLIWTHSERVRAVICVFSLMMLGFFINILAPGNQVRKAGMWSIPAWKAIAKALFQGIKYMTAWTGIWLILALLILTPYLWRSYSKVKIRFRYPFLAAGFGYGIFCSMSCSVFYTMNSTGPARVVAIVYYAYLLFVFLEYWYLLGCFYRITEKMRQSLKSGGAGREASVNKAAAAAWGIIFLILAGTQIFTGGLGETTTARAVHLLKNGEAAGYEQGYRDRLRILEDDMVQNVVFQPYENQPDMLYVGDFPEDAQDMTNQKAAQYFHKKTICVQYN